VALHRIAYLLYHDRENLKAANILILSPNNVFSDYISHILPELGEEHIQEMSFDLFAYKELKEVANDCEDRYDYLEKKMKFQDSEWEIRFKEKQSASFIGQMEGFLAMLEEDLVNIRSITFKGVHKTEEEILHLFYFKFQTVPLLARMDAVMEYLIDEYETLRGKNISEEDMEALRETFQKMYVTTDLYEIYGWLLKDCGYPELSNAEYERRKLEYEDVFPMLYLKYRLKGSRKHKNIKHLVIDEMQDYSYLQYSILSMLFHCRMTILGDRAQTMDSECQDVTKFLPKIFGRKIRKIVMNKSYRNTLEIAEYAERIRGGEGLELFQRHGKEVEEFHGLSMEEMLENIEKQVKSANAQYETAAVITMNESDAYDIYRLLKNRQLPVSYMDRDTSVFKKGMTVTTFYLAKGLEFDQVFAVLGRETNPLYKQAKYISATRALHELYVYEES
jgi:DNA helicase-2/ATP-dependent DNA helicase PcrA